MRRVYTIYEPRSDDAGADHTAAAPRSRSGMTTFGWPWTLAPSETTKACGRVWRVWVLRTGHTSGHTMVVLHSGA
jgi:hypothetical protein